MERLIHIVRGLLGHNQVELARSWQARIEAGRRSEEQAEALRFERAVRTEPGRGRVVLGRACRPGGDWFWVGLPINRLLGQHAMVTGATGTGKTILLLSILLQVLLSGEIPVILVDFKGEFAKLVVDVLLPAIANLPAGDAVLQHLRVIRPFDREHLPLLRITRPEEGIAREVQACALASVLEESLGDDLGTRMSRVFLRLSSLAIELDEPLTVIRDWLEQPARLVRDARRSEDPTLRSYVHERFARENRASIEALTSRLDQFLFMPETRLMLAAPRCVSFADMLSDGLTVIDVGDPPAGAERIARFWSGFFVGGLTRAILSRPVTDTTPQVLVPFEEVQEGLGRHQVEQFGRLLALARHKRASLWFSHQQPSQIADVHSGLLRLLRTNTGIELAFRCNVEDARAFAHALPIPNSSGTSDAQQIIHAMTRLATREYFLWMKAGAPFRAQRVRSPRLDLDGFRARARLVPDDVRDGIRRGTVTLPRHELEQAVESEMASGQPSGLDALLRPVEEEGDGPYPHLG